LATKGVARDQCLSNTPEYEMQVQYNYISFRKDILNPVGDIIKAFTCFLIS